jgi:hypothetical protein
VAEVDWSLAAVFGVAVLFLVWYYAGFLYSRRLAGRIAKELKDAMLALGGTSSIRWFGTTAFRITTEDANPPFRQISLTVTLRPREMPINWAIGTAQGRRDAALVEASLRKEPKVSFELVDSATRLGKRRSRARSGWSPVTVGGRPMLLASDDDGRVLRIVEALDLGTVPPIMALHVTAGSEPGIAASVSVQPGEAARSLVAIRTLGERLTT